MGLISMIKTRGPLWVAVYTGFYLQDKFIEYVLYPNTILLWGLVMGTVSMMVLSLILNWLFLVLYDRLASTWWRDALALEASKKAGWKLRARLKIGWHIGGKQYRIETGGPIYKVLLFIVLSVVTDAMTTTILMRPLNRTGMNTREKIIFFASLFISCTSWALLVWLGLESLGELAPELLKGYEDKLHALLEQFAAWLRANLPGMIH
jgi:hypothetical protein